MSKSWSTFAQRRRATYPGEPFFHFGPQGWAALGDGAGVFEVQVVEDPDGPYWAWIDSGEDRPIYISEGYSSFLRAFRAGDPTSDPNYDQSAGLGRMVRLRAVEVAKVAA